MIIKEVKKDKKHLNLLTLDNGDTVLLDRDTCIENSLYKNEEIDPDRLEELKFQSEKTRAKSRALWYLDRQDYTEKALYTKLLRAGFDKKASASVLARLVEVGLVDDRRYAERFAERCFDSNTSKRASLQKMLEKGVPYDLAKEVLDGFETDEEGQIKALLEKKYAYKLSQPDGSKKVYASLIRKGFSYGAVNKALKEYISDNEFCEEY